MGSNTPNLPSPTVNMPRIQLYLSALEQMLKSTRRYSWIIYDVGVGRFTPTTLSRALRLNYFFLCSPSSNVLRSKHVWQHGCERSDLTKWTFCTCGDQVQVPRLLLYFKRWIRYYTCSISDRFCSSCFWGIIQMHVSVTKHWSKIQKCNMWISDSFHISICLHGTWVM